MNIITAELQYQSTFFIVPQKAEASEMIRHYISVGVRLMKAQVFTQDMVED